MTPRVVAVLAVAALVVGGLGGLLAGATVLRPAEPVAVATDDGTVNLLPRQTSCPVTEAGCSPLAIPIWSDAAGWTSESRQPTIQLADLDGDGQPELLGRTPAGLEVWTFRAASDACAIDIDECGQWVEFVVPLIDAFSDANGFNGRTAATIQAADLDGDGNDELFAWTNGTVIAYDLNADATAVEAIGVVPGLFVADFRNEFETLQSTDINGNGRAEITARTADGLRAFELGPDGTWTAFAPLNVVGDGTPFTADFAWRTLQAADVDGDGRDEIVGVAGGEVYMFDWVATATTGPEGAWWLLGKYTQFKGSVDFTNPAFYRALTVLDFDGDGRDELFVRGKDFMSFLNYGNQPDGYPDLWETLIIAGGDELIARSADAFVANGGLTAADLSGNRADELVFHGPDRVSIYSGAFTNNPKPIEFGLSETTGPAFNSTLGFDAVHAPLLVWAADDSPGGLIASRSEGGIQTAASASQGSWKSASARYPAFEGDAAVAYDAISAGVGATGAGGVRANYAKSAVVLASYRTSLGKLSRPGTVPERVWEATKQRIDGELRAAIGVDTFYGQAGDLLTRTFATNVARASGVAKNLAISDVQTTLANNQPFEIVKTIAAGLSGLADAAKVPALPGVLEGVEHVIDFLEDQPHSGAFQVAIADLDQRLADTFATAVASNSLLQKRVVDDYGLLMTVGRNVESGAWLLDPEARSRAEAVIDRAAELSVYQSLLPIVTEVWVCRERDGHAGWPGNYRCTAPGRREPPEVTILMHNQWDVFIARRHSGELQRVTFGEGVDDGLAAKLFDKPAAGCATTWQTSCAFGLSTGDVYNGAPGWADLPCGSAHVIFPGTQWEAINLYFYDQPCLRNPVPAAANQAPPIDAEPPDGRDEDSPSGASPPPSPAPQ